MNGLLLGVSILSNTFQTMASRSYGMRAKNGKYIFNAIAFSLATLLCLIPAGGKMSFSLEVLPYSFFFALAFGSCTFFNFLALNEGPIALTTLISSYSLLIPTFYGIIFLGDSLGVLAIVGIVLLLFSLFFSNYKKRCDGETGRVTVKWIIYVTIAFIGNGMCSTVQKIQNIKMGGESKNEFMFLAYMAFALVMLVTALIKERGTVISNVKVGGVFIAAVGIFNLVTNMLVMFLNARIAPSIMFPIISAGGVLLTIVAAVLVYKEKLTRFQQIGVVLGILAIVFLNI